MKEILRNKCGFPICFGQVQIDEKSNRNPFDMVQKIESIISFNFNHSIFVFDSMYHSKIISSFFYDFEFPFDRETYKLLQFASQHMAYL